MNTFSRQFFVLFILITAIPVCIMLLWNFISTRNFSTKHLDFELENSIKNNEIKFQNYLVNELNREKKLVDSLKDYNLKLNNYKSIFNASAVCNVDFTNNQTDCVSDINIDSILKNNTFKEDTSSYEVIKKKSGKEKLLIAFFVIPFEKENKGLITIKKVNLETLIPFMGPIIFKLYSGKNTNNSNLIYSNLTAHQHIEMKEFHQKKNFFRPPPPDINTKLKSKIVKIKNLSGKVIATAETGVPLDDNILLFPRDPMLTPIFKQLYFLGILIPLLGLILSLIIGYYFKRNFANPIEELSDASKAVSSGNLNIRVSTNVRNSELQNTMKNFNNMLEGLLEKDELRDSFITNLTHDFRTPLLAEEKTLELIIENIDNSEISEQKDLIEGLLKNNRHLLSMVNMLLETYKFEAGLLTIKKAPLDIKKIFNKCELLTRTLANEKNITINFNLPDQLPEISGDYNYLQRVLINLIGNAIENIPKGSTIEITGSVEDSFFLISVKDNGPGIPEEDARQLFNKYYAGKRTERKVGSGLGLYISKKLIEAHGGTITIESEIGEYSDFIVKIPLK